MTETHATRRPQDAPRLFSVPRLVEEDEPGTGVSLTKTAVPDGPPAVPAVPEGAELVEFEPGEVVEGVVVDGPAPASAGGWMADRRAHLDTAPAIIPAYLRDRKERTEAVRFLARYYGHEWGYYAARTPVYAVRLMSRSPRGAARLTGRWFRWVTDAEAAPMMARAAASDPETWAKVVTVQTHRTAPRRRRTALVAVPAALLIVLAAVLLPAWALALAAGGVASLLGLAGGNPDRPIVARYVAVHLQRRLDSPEVEGALAAIGIKGKADFVSPIAVDGPGWRAEVDLPGAYEADEVLEKRSKLAAAMRRPLSTVWPETDASAHPGRLVLWVAREDPARAARRIWPLMHEGQADLFEEIPFGFDPRGRMVPLRLMYANGLIGGVMGSGKTSAVLVIVLAGALDPTCEMWLYEMKGSGDLDPVKPVCHRYVSGDDDEDCKAALDGLKALERELKRRKKLVAGLPSADVPNGRKTYPHLAKRRELGLHPLLAVFDEAHTLFEHEEYGDEAAAVAGRLIRKARAYGIILIFTTQRPDANSIPKKISDNAIVRFCLAVTGHTANDLVLGTSMYKRGIRATMFDPERDAGTGWLARSALNTRIVRAAFINQAEALAIARRALAVRIAAGTLTGQAAGQVIEDVDDSDLVDHLRAVWPDGEETMHSHRLVEALAAYRPDLYGAWLDGDQAARSTMLATALKPYKGVQTRQINKRGDGGGGKGLRYEDLPDRSGDEEEDIEDDLDEE